MVYLMFFFSFCNMYLFLLIRFLHFVSFSLLIFIILIESFTWGIFAFMCLYLYISIQSLIKVVICLWLTFPQHLDVWGMELYNTHQLGMSL